MRPVLVAITGGSGSGKSLLAAELAAAFKQNAARISQDDFYRDRSHLSPARRAKLNFDRPTAIEWDLFEQTLRHCMERRRVPLPRYDFFAHARRSSPRWLKPKALVIVEGLWLLRRPSLRKLFRLSVFIKCSAHTRLLRRLARDQRSRGRTASSVRRQFWATVNPMHARFVAPQARWAEIVLSERWGKSDVAMLHERLKLLKPNA